MNIGDVILGHVLSFFYLTWWFWAFFVLWPLFRSTWIYWRNEEYEHSHEFKMVFLEMRIPREVKKSPKAMEQVLMGIHQLRNLPGDFREHWIDGEVSKWYSFEIASFGGETHFYIRCYYKHRALIEAAFYSYYTDVELVEVDDYTSRFPKNIWEMYDQGYDLWGGEMKLAKSGAYPIKWYTDFESPDENKEYDPISQFMEVLGKVRPEEIVGIQICAAPAVDKWADEYKHVIDDLKKTKFSEPEKSAKMSFEFPGGPMPVIETSGKDDPFAGFKRTFTARTPGETKVLENIEENMSMPAFRCIVRFIYFSPKSMFYDSFARRGLAGCFNQYATLDMNRFLVNYGVSTKTKIWQKPYVFPKMRNEFRKQRLLYNFVHRKMPPERWMGKLITSYFLNWNFGEEECELSVRSLATLYHPPTISVLTAPHVQRVESRKVGPPAGLAIYGEEEDIDRFK